MIILILLLSYLSLTLAQSPVLPADTTVTIRVSLLPPGEQPFNKSTFKVSLTPPTTLTAELHIPSQPPHSGDFKPLLSASSGKPPDAPSLTAPCSPEIPCPPAPFDRVAFHTRADTAAIALPIDDPIAFVTVYNWRFRGEPLEGVLYLRAGASPGRCPGSARGAPCRARGECVDRACECAPGWGGPSCGSRLLRAPGVSESPDWGGAIRPMRESAVVRVPPAGVTYLYDVGGDSGRVEFRARVLRGAIAVDGGVQRVDGGGGVVSMVVKRAGDNLGEGLEDGTTLPTLYDREGVGQVVVNSGGLYEMVVVGEGVGRWVMALVARGDEAVVSVSARRCGEDGLLDCAFGGEGGVAVGVVVGVCVVGVVVLIVAVLLCLWCCGRKRDTAQKSVSGAWTDVELSKMGDDAE